ncbi:MAG TPA: spore coat U domain-containing protein [Steroidobacter sp.]
MRPLVVLSTIVLSLICSSPWAASCTVSTSGIAFGGYDPFVAQDVDSVANVSVSCDETASYSIALSTGSGTYEQRVMTSGLHQLLYNLYTDATLSTVWGDGTGHSAMVSDTQLVATHTVYGRIPARQNPHVGVYGDTIVITLTF